MKSILYIGNKLDSVNTNITTIETLGNLLKNEGYQIRFASDKRNKIIRLLDMLSSVLFNYKRTDYVLIDTYSTLNFYYAFFVSQLCRVLKLKYIPILHGGDLPRRLEKSPKKSSMIFKNAYQCISPSQYLKNSFDKLGFNNITYIPNTIEIKNYPFKPRQIDTIKLLWVRSFKEIYNPLMAIKVAKQLLDEGIETSLCMVGPDGDGTFLYATNLARKSEVDVTFTGKLTRSAWIKLSEAYNVFINTSFFDNMPVSLIEAMALGLPVVTTNVGGIPSLVTHNEDAILVEAADVREMVNAVKHLASHPELVSEITTKARQKAEHFDWTEVRKKWQNLLK